MKTEVPPVFIIGAIVIVLGLVVFGAVHVMTPHERVIKTTGIKLPPAMQQRLLAMQQQHALANRPLAGTTTH